MNNFVGKNLTYAGLSYKRKIDAELQQKPNFINIILLSYPIARERCPTSTERSAS
jgi:hypothetical protein